MYLLIHSYIDLGCQVKVHFMFIPLEVGGHEDNLTLLPVHF